MGKEITTIKILSEEVTAMVTASKAQVAQQINAGLTLLYWNIGHRIKTEILKESRATYGEEILSSLSKHLTENFGCITKCRKRKRLFYSLTSPSPSEGGGCC